MPPSLVATVAALALAAGGPPQQVVRDAALSASGSVPEHGVLEETLSTSGGVEALRDTALTTLAPAPEKVVLTTRSFGTVTVDHRAHLARKAHCADCHGKGPVTKIELTPRVAHDRCIGCHREQQHGPMGCRECHEVKPPSPAPTTLAQEAPAAAGKREARLVAPAAPAAPAPGAPAAALSGGAPPAPSPRAAPTALAAAAELEEPPEREHRFMRVLSAGVSGLSGAGEGASGGPAFYFTARQDGYLLSVSVEKPGRTLGLVGAGAVVRLNRRFNALALGVGGFDAAQSSSLSVMPALGGRVGIEWVGGRSNVGLCVTGLSDLTRPTDAQGNGAGGFTVSFAATVGWVVAD